MPASEKLVSLFESHADIIVKGGRQVQYGHKLNLATGKSGLILDIVIETGNPADAERFLSMLDRHIARTGAPPRQTAADGGYASRANLAAAKAGGVADVAFHKKCGIAITEMVKSPWVYRRLRNFRAGGAQPGAVRPAQTGLAAPDCTPMKNRQIRPPSTARLPIPVQVVATNARNAPVAHRARVVPPLLHR